MVVASAIKAVSKKRVRRIVGLLNERTTMLTVFIAEALGWRAPGEGLRRFAHQGQLPRISQISLPFIPHRATTAHAEFVHAA
jgi:hypothetical protein